MEQNNNDQSVKDAVRDMQDTMRDQHQMMRDQHQMMQQVLQTMQAKMARMEVQNRAPPIRREQQRRDVGLPRYVDQPPFVEKLEAPPIRREQQRRDVGLPSSGKCQIIHWRQGQNEECHPPHVDDKYHGQTNISDLKGEPVEQPNVSDSSLEFEEQPRAKAVETHLKRPSSESNCSTNIITEDKPEDKPAVDASETESTSDSFDSSTPSSSTFSGITETSDDGSTSKELLLSHSANLGESLCHDISPSSLRTTVDDNNMNFTRLPPELASATFHANSVPCLSNLKQNISTSKAETVECQSNVHSGMTACFIDTVEGQDTNLHMNVDHSAGNHAYQENECVELNDESSSQLTHKVSGRNNPLSSSSKNEDSLHGAASSEGTGKFEQKGMQSVGTKNSGCIARRSNDVLLQKSPSSKSFTIASSAVQLSSDVDGHSIATHKSLKVDNARTIPIRSSESTDATPNGLRTSVKTVVKQFMPPQVSRRYPSELMLFPYDHFVKLYNRDKVELRPCGLTNCGNSCYANSVIEQKAQSEVYKSVTSKFDWLNPSSIKDANGRRPDDPLYDKRTLHIPSDALKKMSASQKQYWSVKCQYMDVVLFFKIGKFYELYELDAEIGQRELDWKMTMSGVGKCRQVGISEAGIDDAVQKLVARGYKVGRMEQLETSDQAKARGGSSVIQRKLIEISIPSTVTHGTIGPEAVNLLAVKEGKQSSVNGSTIYGFAFLDSAALKFWVGSVSDDDSRAALGALLMQVSPREVVYESSGLSRETHRALTKYASAGSTKMQMTPAMPSIDFLDACEVRKLVDSEGYFRGSSKSWSLAFDCLANHDLVVCALGGLIYHLSRLMLHDALRNGELLPYHVYKSCLRMDGQTLVNLEIFSNNADGGLSGTLYTHLDHCITASGKRLLRRWICHPLKNIDDINDWHIEISLPKSHAIPLPGVEQKESDGRCIPKSFDRIAADSLFPEWKIWTQFLDETTMGLRLDALAESHPIEVDINHASEIDEIFDAISYKKGASVIRMLQSYLGAECFQRSLASYIKKLACSNVKTEALWAVLENESGEPVRLLMDSWTKQKVLDPPDPEIVEDALHLLVHIKALGRPLHHRGRYEPTFYGRLLDSLPLSFDASVLILRFGETGLLREGILLSILMDAQPLSILQSDTAAADFCNISKAIQSCEPEKHFMEDVVGLVSLLGSANIEAGERSDFVLHDGYLFRGENSSLRSSFSEAGENDEDISSDQSSGQVNRSATVSDGQLLCRIGPKLGWSQGNGLLIQSHYLW